MSERVGSTGGVHPVVRLNYQTRVLACPLVATVMMVTRWSAGEPMPSALWQASLFYALAWPHLAYAFSRRTGDALREQPILFLDTTITGAAIAFAGFRPFIALCLGVPVATFSASLGGLSFMLRGVALLAVSALLTGVVAAGFAMEETPVVAQVVGASSLALFQTVMGLFTFRTARAFVESGRQLTHQAEKIQRQNVELVAARESALEAAKAKAAFLATMSHEIRTPLNGVLGMTRLLAETPLSAEQQDLLRTVRSSGDTLVTVINDILDFSRVESGKLELEQEPLDVVPVVEDALEIVSDTARRKGVELVCEIAGEPPPTILGDATRLRQVVTNLAGNAVKFTEEGEVVVTLRRLRPGSATEPAEIGISVRDTGIGIPADRIPLLFTAFSQADTSTTRRYGGTGLGLAISKRLVGLMGGDIHVESEPGKGSTFSFTLRGPLAPGQARPVTPPDHRVKVLVVDDNATNRRALCGQLHLWGMESKDADGAEQALATLAHDGPFDVAILDYHMPVTDGMELARRIRATGEGASLPLVLLSSSLVLARDDLEGLFSARLLKPARQSSLFDAIATALGAKAPTRPADASPREIRTDVSRLRILVADDNRVNRDIAKLVLRRFGASADEAGNGREAVDRVAQAALAADGQGYDLVLMDMQMPDMDGLEATIAIRRLQGERPSLRWPRIVAMTANAMQEDRAKCMEAGMDDYLIKPLDFEEVGRVLGQAALRLADARDAAPAREEGGDLVDWSRLDELAEYDTPEGTVVRGAIASLADQAPLALEAIRRSLGEGDADGLRAAAHRLKGAAANLGATALSGLAARLESAAKEGTLEGLEPLLDELGTVLEATRRSLDDYARRTSGPDGREDA